MIKCGNYKPCCPVSDVLRGEVDEHSWYSNVAFFFHLDLDGFLEVAGNFANTLADLCFCHPITL